MDILTTKEMERLPEVLRKFLRKKERVLLCFPGEDSHLGAEFARIVRECGATPVFWGKDLLWKTLLQKGFSQRCATVVGSSGILLGLSKLSKRMGTPLYIRNAVVVGVVPDDWLVRSIEQGLDCRIHACYSFQEETAQDESLVVLSRELRRWTTILDFRLERQGPGLSLDIITFSGEKLPKLPSVGRLVVRVWNPEEDIPFDVPFKWRNMIFSGQKH